MPEDRGVGKRLSKSEEAGKRAPRAKDVAEGLGRAMKSAAGEASAPAAAEQERETLSTRASSLSSELTRLRSEASLAGLRDSLEDLSGTLSGLPAALEKVRQEGYVYKSYLENKIQVLQEQWRGLGERIDREAAQQGRVLVREADALQRRLSAMGSNLNAAALDAVERDIGALEGKVGDIRSGIAGLFDNVQSNVHQTERQIQRIRWALEQVAEASFRLRTDENVVEAVEAQYLTEEKDGPEGILYLTDQRIIFEQKEDVATKKFLFITTEKERVQEVLLEAPVGSIEEARPSERRAIVRMKELLQLNLGPQAPVSQAVFQLKEDSEAWQGYIGRVLSGDIDRERVGAEVAPVEEEVAVEARPAAAAVPTNCPTCGANITTEIVRGMRSVTCEYCGTVIRL